MTARKKTKTVDLEQMLAEYNTPEWNRRIEEDERFMRQVVYAEFRDLNDGFDSPLIGHFSPKDFLVLIDRCESLHIGINGIEVFKIIDVGPPSRAMLLEVEIAPKRRGYKWARRLVQSYLRKRRITVSATFRVPRPLPALPANESFVADMVQVLGGHPSKIRSTREPEANSGHPAVGIFFVRGNDLWTDSTPVEEAVPYGDMMTHEKGHDAFWGELQACGAVPSDEEYGEVPRGRVCYDIRSQIYHLYVDGCILRDKEMVRKINRAMTLPSAPRTEISTDSHYKCPLCMSRLVE